MRKNVYSMESYRLRKSNEILKVAKVLSWISFGLFTSGLALFLLNTENFNLSNVWLMFGISMMITSSLIYGAKILITLSLPKLPNSKPTDKYRVGTFSSSLDECRIDLTS